MKNAVAIALAASFIALIVAVFAAAGLSGQQHTISRMQAQLARADAVIDAQSQEIQGTRADLITCADLQNLQMTGTDDLGNQVSVGAYNGGSGNGVVLPAHCINR